MKYRVTLTRDCTLTQSCDVFVEAESKEHAEERALDIPQDDPRCNWVDDGSFHAGEEGTYIADPDLVEECA